MVALIDEELRIHAACSVFLGALRRNASRHHRQAAWVARVVLFYETRYAALRREVETWTRA